MQYPRLKIRISHNFGLAVMIMMTLFGMAGCRENSSKIIERDITEAYVLIEKGENEKALELLLDAQSHIDDDASPALRAKLYQLLTSPYYHAYRIGSSKEYAEKAVEEARAADSLQWLPSLLWNLALSTQNVDSVEMLLSECRDLSDVYGSRSMAGRSRIFLAKMSLLKGDPAKAKRILDSLASQSPLDEGLMIDLQMQRALLYEHQGKYLEVIDELDSIPRVGLSIDGKSNLYEMLYGASRKSGRLEEALLYRDSLVICRDSVNSIRNSEKLTETEFNHSRRLMKEEEKLRLMWWIGGTALLFMIGVIIFLSRSRAMKSRQLKLIERIAQLNSRLVELENRKTDTPKTDTLDPIMEKFRLTREFFFTLPQSELVNVLNMTPNPDDIPKEKLKALTESVTGTFAEVCANLRQTETDVTQDDAWLCVCSYIDLNKDVTGAVMRSSDDALRKRKSRIRQKLPPALFELFFCK